MENTTFFSKMPVPVTVGVNVMEAPGESVAVVGEIATVLTVPREVTKAVMLWNGDAEKIFQICSQYCQ